MKKSIVLAAIFIASVAAVAAQPRAIGVRLTNGVEASYQHYLGKNFIQADLGLGLWGHGFGTTLAGTYNWIIVSPQWTSQGTWDFYAGVGIGLGLNFRNAHYAHGKGTYFGLGVAGNVGLSYTFDFPLQLAIEERPIIGGWFGHKSHFWGGWYPALAIRYAF